MDLDKTLRELYEEKKRLDRAIARLEERRAEQQQPKRSTRGRKSMGPEERLQVSARMAAYWAARRAGLAAADSTPPVADGVPPPDDTPDPQTNGATV